MDSDKKVLITAVIGAGTGITIGQFISEFVVRLTGKTGLARLGIKALVKVALFAGFYMMSGRFSGLLSFGTEVISYGIAGSIFLDIAEFAVPGGVIATAEAVAVSVRSTLRKVPQGPVSQERRQIEQQAVSELL